MDISLVTLRPTVKVGLSLKLITWIAFDAHSISDSRTMYGSFTGRSISSKNLEYPGRLTL